MTHAEALDFLSFARPQPGRWADIGAGTGTFTRALAELVGRTGTILAIDSDAGAVSALRRLERPAGDECAGIIAVQGDMRDMSAIPELAATTLTGALFANALHFTDLPERVLAQTAERLDTHGRIVIIEYERRSSNPWVPHPLPFDRLNDVARAAGMSSAERVAQRPSRYHGEMYCAVLCA